MCYKKFRYCKSKLTHVTLRRTTFKEDYITFVIVFNICQAFNKAIFRSGRKRTAVKRGRAVVRELEECFGEAARSWTKRRADEDTEGAEG